MAAMIAFLDDGVKNVTDALKAKKAVVDPNSNSNSNPNGDPAATMWDNTIVIFSAGGCGMVLR
jgi:hypothetical protein